MIKKIAVVASVVALAAPASAVAQTAREGYTSVLGQVGEVQSQPSGTAPSATPTAASPTPAQPVAEGSLPFTGADIGIVAGLGIALLAAGFTLRRIREN
jgi:hypothetical protein